METFSSVYNSVTAMEGSKEKWQHIPHKNSHYVSFEKLSQLRLS